MSARRPEGLRLSHLPGTPLASNPRRPLDVRLRAELLRPEVATIAIAVLAVILIGVATDWQAARVLAGFFVGLVS